MMRVLLLLCGVWGGWGVWGVGAEIGVNMNELSRHLQQEMADVLDLAAVNYSEPVITVQYRASSEFDMRAMGPLYNSTHMILDLIVAKQAYPEGIVSISDGHVEVASLRDNWRVLVSHYAGPLALVSVALLAAGVLPLAGLLWCCCYWCRGGRRRRPFDRKYDGCVRGLLAIVLIALLTLFLFGVVCLFCTEAQVEAGAAGAGGAARASLRDAREFLNATAAHARHLLVDNYAELSERLKALLHTSGVMVSMKLGEFSHAVSVTSLNQLVLRLDDVQADLRRVQNLTASLRARADDLNAGLRKVRKHLLDTLASCDQPKCVALQNKYNIGQLNTEIHYSQIPDVSELLRNVTALLEGNIKEEVGAGQKVFRDIQAGIRRSVQETLPGVTRALDDTAARLAGVARAVGEAAAGAARRLDDAAPAAAERLHARYGPYRRYLGLAAAAAPTLVAAVVAWGLVCGVCGKRPDGYGAADCCNKGQGSKCLLCGVCMMFVVGAGAALVVAAYFVVGAVGQRLLCDPLTEPRGNLVFQDVERFVQLERALYGEPAEGEPALNVTRVLERCHRNHTLYAALQLRRRWDVARERDAALGALRARAQALRPALPARTAILRPAARRQLQALADAGLSEFDFERILDALDTNLTSLDLTRLAELLGNTSRALAAPAPELARAAAALRRLHADLVLPMQRDTAALNRTATRLRDEMRFNHSSLKEAIKYLMDEAAAAEQFLNAQGPARLRNLTQEFAAVLELRVSEYLARLQHAADHTLGRCAPLSNAFNATRDAVCNNILMATNGYWVAMSWCLLLFPALLLVSVRLARLYLHVDAYPGPLVEAEYLYDAYADRDNVPLANAYKGEKRERGARGRREEARPEPAPPALARRYNDMAPKHWEEGPPRYLGPTEYERPPPYYYPGPHDRQ